MLYISCYSSISLKIKPSYANFKGSITGISLRNSFYPKQQKYQTLFRSSKATRIYSEKLNERNQNNFINEPPHSMKKSKKFNSFPFEYHKEFIMTVDDITNLGVGVGRVELSDGSKWVVFVPLVLPGEEIKVKIYKNNPTYSEADLVEVIKPSVDRSNPQCIYFSVCGGCQYQHMNIESQRFWKRYFVFP